MDDGALAIFNSVFTSGNAFVYRCENDEHFTMTFMAGQVEKLCGRAQSDFMGNRSVSYADVMHPEDLVDAQARIDAAIDARENWDVSYRLMHPSGHVTWVRERGSAIFDADGNVQLLEGLVVDASAEVNLRQELEETLQQTEASNRETIDLAENILRSVQKLSILAINAGIEAARAGKSGVGFAYLAREIKALADENSQYASRITAAMADRKAS